MNNEEYRKKRRFGRFCSDWRIHTGAVGATPLSGAAGVEEWLPAAG